LVFSAELSNLPTKLGKSFMTNERRFYTYAWLRKNGTPYYIGKGSGRRAWKESGRAGKARKPPENRILILKDNLTEEEAFRHEIYMIAIYGRVDRGTGILHNYSDGGEGLSSPSPEVVAKIVESRKGYKHSPETIAKIKEKAKHRRKPTEEENRRNSERNRGEKNPRFGAVITEETRQKLRKASTGRKWFRSPDGTQETLCLDGEQPEGWTVGRRTSFAENIWEVRRDRGTDKWRQVR
jgi:hypothetical protein